VEGQRRARGGGLGTFNAEAYLAVEENRRRMEWGAEVERDYSGWLEVAEGTDGESQVTVHLSFGERSLEPAMREQVPEGRDRLAEGISATLESKRRQVEVGSARWSQCHLPLAPSQRQGRTRPWSTSTHPTLPTVSAAN
jgi:hypothetical protein